jgi:hypothetical protein
MKDNITCPHCGIKMTKAEWERFDDLLHLATARALKELDEARGLK